METPPKLKTTQHIYFGGGPWRLGAPRVIFVTAHNDVSDCKGAENIRRRKYEC